MRSPTRARLTFAALVCVAAVALAGCGGSPDAPPLAGGGATTPGSATQSPSASSTPPATTDPTPTASPSPSATKGKGGTTTGGAAKGRAAEAAKKVAQAFVAGDNVATKTGKFTARDKVTASSCAWCARKKAFVAKIYSGGGHIQGELFTQNTYTVAGPTRGVYTVIVNTTVSRYKEVDGSGKVLDSRGDRDGLLVLQVGTSTPKVVAASWQPAT